MLERVKNGISMKKGSFLYKQWLALLALPFLSGCNLGKKNFIQKNLFTHHSMQAHNKLAPDSIDQSIEERPPVTIWIHGTKGFFHRFKRINPVARFFYTHDGLNSVEELDESMHHRIIGEMLIASDPAHCVRGHVYLFGWCGTLTFSAREKAAHELHIALDALIKEYQTLYGYTPKIRIITHSHGGNVALNLAAIKNEYSTDLSIDELILLACPVQDQTECFVGDPIFKRVYSLYSNRDLFQIMDPQGAYAEQRCKVTSFLSRRRFKPCPQLVQVKIKVNKRALSHVEFMLSRFIRMIPSIITEINSWDKETQDARNTEHILAVYTHNYKHPSRLEK